MSVEDAKVDIGCTGIMVSNHGGRQLDGSRSPFDQLAEIVDAVGDKLDVICEGGIIETICLKHYHWVLKHVQVVGFIYMHLLLQVKPVLKEPKPIQNRAAT